MDHLWADLKIAPIISTVVYSIIGLIIFGAAYHVMDWVFPFSLRKELEEDQNVALAILMGSIFIALAIIIQAAIRG